MKEQIIKAQRGFMRLYEDTLAGLELKTPQELSDLQHEAKELRNSELYSHRVAGEIVHTACTQLLQVV